MGEEADALTEQGWDEIAADDEREFLISQYRNKIDRAVGLYNIARQAEVGATICCPWCTKRIVKRTYNRTFCSNQRTHGRNNCKDRFWNNVSDKRRERAQEVNAGKHKPGTARFEWALFERQCARDD